MDIRNHTSEDIIWSTVTEKMFPTTSISFVMWKWFSERKMQWPTNPPQHYHKASAPEMARCVPSEGHQEKWLKQTKWIERDGYMSWLIIIMSLIHTFNEQSCKFLRNRRAELSLLCLSSWRDASLGWWSQDTQVLLTYSLPSMSSLCDVVLTIVEVLCSSNAKVDELGILNRRGLRFRLPYKPAQIVLKKSAADCNPWNISKAFQQIGREYLITTEKPVMYAKSSSWPRSDCRETTTAVNHHENVCAFLTVKRQ